MYNKIETLRAIGWDTTQLTTILNLSSIDTYSTTDKEMIVEFKRIYEQGSNQFNKFVTLLDQKGSSLDEFSLIYYTTQLKNGPFKQKALEQTGTYWKKSPDSMAQNSNEDGLQYPLDANICGVRKVTFNKMPRIMQQSQAKMSSAINSMSSITGSQLNVIDNTMPCLVKGNANRYIDESTGGTNALPHALYNTNDVETAVIKKNTSASIKASAATYLGSEDYRIQQYKFNTNPFITNDETKKLKIEHNVPYRTITYSNTGEEQYTTNNTTIVTDIIGNVYETDEARATTVIIAGKDKDVSIKLHTIDGQLGSNVTPK